MKIQVDFYKPSGKWYTGGTVDIGDARPHIGGEVEQALVDSQHILQDGWQGSFVVVVSNGNDTPSTDPSCKRMYPLGCFAGMRRTEEPLDWQTEDALHGGFGF